MSILTRANTHCKHRASTFTLLMFSYCRLQCMQSCREIVTMEIEVMGDTLNPWRSSRPRKCVKLFGKSSSTPGLLSMVSTCTNKMSQFHSSQFQEPAFSLGPCNFKTLEMYLYGVYPLHFHIKGACQQFAVFPVQKH